jgi:two-component system sensor histidine kinase UhpB
VVYRVAQESLVNVVRHARATRAELSLQAENGEVVLRVRDDGKGIDPLGLRSGNGVRGMRERALLVGADLRVTHVVPHGTEVQLRLPVK